MKRQIILGFVVPVSMGLVIAFVPNGIIWLLFSLGSAIVILCVYSLALRVSGKPSPIYRRTQPPWWFDATLSFIGVILVVSTAPGLFFGQPNWAIDHVYRAISLIIGNAA